MNLSHLPKVIQPVGWKARVRSRPTGSTGQNHHSEGKSFGVLFVKGAKRQWHAGLLFLRHYFIRLKINPKISALVLDKW